jgi:glutaredoxin 3
MQAEIYTKTICPFCTRAKALLNEKGIPYQEYIISAGINESNIASNQQFITKDVLLTRLPTAETVPQIWLDGQHIGGYTELSEYFAENSK